MKKAFYTGLALLVVFEFANVYFIMPLPYSQRVRSIDLAYFLYAWRWPIRVLCGLLVLSGTPSVARTTGWRRWIAVPSLLAAAAVVFVTNDVMSADHIFIAPTHIDMRPATANVVEPSRLVVGIVLNGDARAYPIQFIGYHHQVRDTVAGRSIMVSFCTVCRTGRVFDPTVQGKVESFRLVGMDHFNAMFEDETTHSWWRQATGNAVAGPRKGAVLVELPSQQVTLAEWLAMHPNSLVMQPDPALRERYSKSFDYETGASRSTLTGTDSASWHDKSWVVGLALAGESKAYDWNRLRREGVINDVVGGTPVVLALASDHVSFVAFERPDPAATFVLRNDSLVGAGRAYSLNGRGTADSLRLVSASQEFWHSWRTFHPQTTTY